MSEQSFKLGQQFVDRVTTGESESPAVQGAGAIAPLTPEVWRAAYIAAMMKHAHLTEQEATDCFEAGNGGYDFSEDPEQSALDEISYWDADE